MPTVDKFLCTCGAKQKVKHCKQDMTVNTEVSNYKAGEKLTMFSKTISKLLPCDILSEEPDSIVDMLLDPDKIC